MKYVVMVPLCLLAGACTQTAVLGDGGGGVGGSPAVGGNGAGGSPPSSAMVLGAQVCEAREACETVEASCAHETGCVFTIFREELHMALETCLSSCGSSEACWQAALAGSTPPDELALYVSACNQSGAECEGDPDAMGSDWCEYDFLSAENYAAMIGCFGVSCGDIQDCLRGVVFADEPSCFDF